MGLSKLFTNIFKPCSSTPKSPPPVMQVSPNTTSSNDENVAPKGASMTVSANSWNDPKDTTTAMTEDHVVSASPNTQPQADMAQAKAAEPQSPVRPNQREVVAQSPSGPNKAQG